MSEVCGTCGLPPDLCVCVEAGRAVTVHTEERRYGKQVTVVEGLDPARDDPEDLAIDLESKLACGGIVDGGTIELQGDHVGRVADLLGEMGFTVRRGSSSPAPEATEDEAVCGTCDLPVNLCVCEQTDQDEPVTVAVERRRQETGVLTTVSGLDRGAVDIHRLTADLKSDLDCEATVEGDRVELRGEFPDRTRRFLEDHGFTVEFGSLDPDAATSEGSGTAVYEPGTTDAGNSEVGYCPDCGAELPDSGPGAFCGACGAELPDR
jgi:translation initiation factor 1